jgi:hypothetical protein
MSPPKTQQKVMHKPIRIIRCIGAKSELFWNNWVIEDWSDERLQPAPPAGSLTMIFLCSHHKFRSPITPYNLRPEGHCPNSCVSSAPKLNEVKSVKQSFAVIIAGSSQPTERG